MSMRTEEELLKEKKKLEEEREDFIRQTKEFEERQEDEQRELQRQYHVLEDMRNKVSPNDHRLISLINENQELMESLRIRGIEMLENVKENLRKKKTEWYMREEDLMDEMKRLRELEGDQEENP